MTDVGGHEPPTKPGDNQNVHLPPPLIAKWYAPDVVFNLGS